MKLKLASLAVILFASTQVHAQSTNTPLGLGAQANIESLSKTGIGKTYDNRYEGAKGTPFMNDEFLKAKVTLEGNVVFDNIPVKYNVFENTILYTNDKGNLMVFGANQVDRLEFTDLKFGSKNKLGKLEGLETVNPKAADNLVVYLYEGKEVKFTALPSKELVKADYKGSSYSAGRNYDEFFDKTEYYLKLNNGTVSKVKLNKKSLLTALSDKTEQVKAYVAKEKIDASTEDGWVKTLAYYETL